MTDDLICDQCLQPLNDDGVCPNCDIEEEEDLPDEEIEDSAAEAIVPSKITLFALLARATASREAHLASKAAASRIAQGKRVSRDTETVAAWTWHAVGFVLRTKVRDCGHCGSIQTYTDGWFTAYAHRTDTHARKLVVGRAPIAGLPFKVESVRDNPSEHCPFCVDKWIELQMSLGHSAPEPMRSVRESPNEAT